MPAYPAKINRTVRYRTAAGKWRPAVITGGIPATLTVTASSRTGGVTTLTVTNSLATPRNIHVNLADATYNGIFRIASANGTTVTYNQPGVANDADGGTGTIRDVDTCNIRVGHTGGTFTAKLRRHGYLTKNDRWRPA